MDAGKSKVGIKPSLKCYEKMLGSHKIEVKETYVNFD